jgi:SAM-dependent methyltransferase
VTAPFDPLAPDYDAHFTDSIIGRWLRDRVHARLDAHWRAGAHVLELGCGTGADALRLAQRGVHVTATDSSAAMRAITAAKIEATGRVTVEPLDLHVLPDNVLPGPFDGALANFGPLNVLDDWRPLARWLAARVRPGGLACAAVMGPVCAWEIGWHGLHGDLGTALRRLRGSASFQSAPDQPAIAIHYPSIRRISADFAPYFARVAVSGLGVFLPPSDVYGVIERRRHLLHALLALEERCAGWSPLARLADHYWIEWVR